jgi:hypothetical protein
MKKLIKLGVLFLSVFVFTNCLDDNDNKPIYYFYDEPAVIDSLGDNSIVRTPHGKFLVSTIGGDSLKIGDLLWTAFRVDPNDGVPESTSTKQHKATNFSYKKVDSTKVILPADTTEFKSYLSDDYSAFIYEAVLYRDYIDKLLFFGFRRETVSDNLTFKYEMILNPEIEAQNGYPTFYIRSQKMDLVESHSGHRETIFAFDMTEFLRNYKESSSDKKIVKFNLKYKVGVDEEGKDVYREFKSNPISWNVDLSN